MTRPVGSKNRKGDLGRLLEKISPEPNSGCWLWDGSYNWRGYGTLHFERRMHLAHRVSFLLHGGSIPDGHEIDHLCRNRACVNPDHLEAVDHQTNCKRSPLIGRTGYRTGRNQYV